MKQRLLFILCLSLLIPLGFAHAQDGSDRDGDGLEDWWDACVDTPGPIENMGCPEGTNSDDSDGDGVWDIYDACPDIASTDASGCPDSDGDGLIDINDACVTAAGLVENMGCPEGVGPDDSDGDGAWDTYDACPDIASTDTFLGCPDSDADGVADILDACPDDYGTSATDGCEPVLTLSLPAALENLIPFTVDNAHIRAFIGGLRVEVRSMGIGSNGLLAINTRWRVEIPYSNTSVREWRTQAYVYDLNAPTLSPLLTFERNGFEYNGRDFMSLSADGQTLATLRVDRTLFRPIVEVWSLPDGELIQTLHDPCHSLVQTLHDSHPDADNLQALKLNPDGSRVVLAFSTPPAQACRASAATVVIFDVASGEIVDELVMPEPILQAAYSPSYLALASVGHVYLLDATTHDLLLTLDGGVTIFEPRPLTFSADETLVAWGNRAEVMVYETATGEVAFWTPPQPMLITALAFSPDMLLLAVGDMLSNLQLYDLDTAEVVAEIYTQELMPQGVAFSPDGKLLMYYHRMGLFMGAVRP